jgi:tetratricopeptide (TPR) repeat protein
MLGFAWLTVRQAQEALRSGRLEEALRLLGQPTVRAHKRAGDLLQQLARAFTERGERQLRHDDAIAAWNDLLKAEQVGVPESSAVRLRQALTRLGVAEVRALLEAGEPARAAEAIAQLRDRLVNQPELKPLEEAAKDWAAARELAERGEFAQALETLERVRPRLTTPLGSLERFQNQLLERKHALGQLLLVLHEAAAQDRWHEVLQLSDQVLALAPQHGEARRVRARAWKAIEPPTVVANAGRQQVTIDQAKLGPPSHYLLWIDNVGGFLICLGNRITFGQATPDNDVDVALLADVSRAHASLARDAEGAYVLEALRPVQVNGQVVDRALLKSGDRVTLGTSCQFQFRQAVPVSGSARLDLVSGHRLRLALDGVLLMAETLVLGPGQQTHVAMPDLKQPLVLFRHRDGLGIRSGANMMVNGQPVRDRALLEGAATVSGDDFSLSVEPVNKQLERG